MLGAGPVAQAEAQRAVRATVALLGAQSQGVVDTRRVSALLLSMEAERVLEAVLAGMSERVGAAVQDAIGEE